MSSTTWTPRAVSAEAQPWQGRAWRLIESQHIASTMKLVDDPIEQDVLESLLDASKPPLPAATEALDYLLATPFRYPSRRGGTRFRASTDPGVFYGAQTVRTAAAELGYWRCRFVRDAEDIVRLDPVPHTAFRVEIATLVVDLRLPPFDRDHAVWQDPQNYGATQAFAAIVRQAALGAIVYRSVRDPQPAWCVALLDPSGFGRPRPHPHTQTWYLAASAHEAIWRRDHEAMRFEFDA